MAARKEISRSLKIYLDGHEVKNSLTSIKVELTAAKKELSKAQIGSDEYRKAMEKIGRLKGILNEHKSQLKELEQTGESLFAKAKKWITSGLFAKIGFNSLDGLMNKMTEFRDMFNQKESSAANLKALTGLDDSSIDWLTKQAEKLSTSMDETGLRVTQSSQEILEAYMLVGSAKPELLSDQEALNAVTVEAMRLAQAAKMDLGDAVNGVTLALNQYGAGADEAAKYVNVLAAGSKFGAAGVEAQTAAIIKSGVAAASAGVPIEQLVGSIETLAEKGIKGEVAGTGLKTFFLRLESMSEDCRPSVVGLQTALENLAAKNMDAKEMQAAFGLETYTVAQAMISNAESVKQYTQAVTDTNVATEQAAINSETTESKMAQLTNKINEQGMALWEVLAPAFNIVLEGASGFLGIFPPLLSFIGQHITLISSLAGIILIYNSRLAIMTAMTKAQIALEGVWNTIKTSSIFLFKLWTTQLNLANLTTQRYLLTIKNGGALTGIFSAATLLLKTAFLALTGQTSAAAASLQVLNAALKANPIGLIITGVTALVGAVTWLTSSTDDAAESTDELTGAQTKLQEAAEKAQAQADEERVRIQALIDVIHDNTASYDDKRKAMANLQKIIPGYNATLSKEGKVLRENTKAIDDYLAKLDQMALAQAYYDEYVRIQKEKAAAQRDVDLAKTRLSEYKQSHPGAEKGRTTTTYGTVGSYQLHEDDTEFKRLEHSVSEAEQKVSDFNSEMELLNKTIKSQTSETQKLFTDLQVNGGKFSDNSTPTPAAPHSGGGSSSSSSSSSGSHSSRHHGRGRGSSNTPHKTTPPPKTTDPKKEEEERKREEEKRIREELERINIEYDLRMNELKEKFRKGEIASETDYRNQLEDLTLERLAEQLKVEGLSEQQQVAILSRTRDILVAHKEELNKLFEDIDRSSLSHYEQQERDIKNREKQQIESLKRSMQLGLITYEEYLAAAAKIRAKTKEDLEDLWKESDDYKAALKALEQYIADRTKALEGSNKNEGFGAFTGGEELAAEIKAVKEALTSLDPESDEYQRLKDFLNGLENMMKEKGEAMKAIVSDLGSSLGTMLGDAIAGNEQGVKDALKSLINIVLDGIEKMILASMTIPAIESLAGPAGWAKAATTLAKIAAIKAAFAATKAAVQSFDTGGYTGAGQWNEPRGVVHAGEFVANRFAVSNPAVRPILDLIDNAQRSGNIRQLTAEDIAAVATPMATLTRGRTTTQSDRETQRMLAAVAATVAKLNARLDEPITARTYATGKYGTMEAEELARKMRNNSLPLSRRS